ncbi:phage head spike fiber domain-containing protein [Rhodoferax mekongensis]|uniref:LamG domain-containing protein n=1 Tax=Rhodoferax mekongensis TaxID=3068341 RepID=A0ABZ0B295_9BURK|nr:hypothetical protein [Rhodoferax sp. TBRC 17307]WNO06043.1 hypothetical protein RAN89_06330 [Rhodoferax sp. TBRC 17307]
MSLNFPSTARDSGYSASWRKRVRNMQRGMPALDPLVAALSLDFTRGSLDPRVTFTRPDATSCATRFNAQGLLQVLAPNSPRFDYDPATLQPSGLLIEESRTNLFIDSRDMTTASWSKTDVTPTRNQVGIDGVANTACLMTEGVAGTSDLNQGLAGLPAGATVTSSRYLKRGNNDWIRLAVASSGGNGWQAWLNLATGALGTSGALGAGAGSASVQNVGNGWYRLTITATIGGADTDCNNNIYATSANSVTARVNNATYIMDAAQLEVGAFATSFILTGASTATRAADSALMTGANFSSWYNQSRGALFAEASTFATTSARGVLSVNDGTSNNKFDIRFRSSSTLGTIAGSGIWAIGPVISDAKMHKIALSISANSQLVAADGLAPSAAAAATLPAVTQLQIGGLDGGASQQLNGYIRRIAYFDTQLAPDQIVAFTK